ncbi:hypothetical protein JTE90_014083 [Oedothorax gibbosus]|uniref:Uncharacterized protein n=1 Tax=Oedothorax gibbosus TaxID=931172 RepID=A0AAV6V6F0_9ARAC|nr:hypothetical protein JTE90_014083 [Oedothorax gibbosus]
MHTNVMYKLKNSKGKVSIGGPARARPESLHTQKNSDESCVWISHSRQWQPPVSLEDRWKRRPGGSREAGQLPGQRVGRPHSEWGRGDDGLSICGGGKRGRNGVM